VVSAGHRCNVIAPPQAIIVWGDKSKIQVVLNNLIESVISLSSAGERNHRDSGRSERFGRKAQTASGQGWGLFIARKLMDSQRGAIWAESQIGCGLRFSFSLPMVGGEKWKRKS
jgi:signal transduction histidine kinase